MRTSPGLFTLALALFAASAHPATDAEALAQVASAIETAIAAEAPFAPEHLVPCVGGMAGIYPCSNIDLLEFMPVAGFAASATNSGWGWTDSLDGREYYLLGLDNGTAFIDITNPTAAVYLGKLPTHSGSSNTWRDVRVYQNHAYIVSEQSGHGMQVFDLTQLRNVVAPPVTFSETAFYNKVSNTHTISINEETGYAYLVGTTGGSPPVVTCGGNLHIVNLANPVDPQFVACYNDGGYIHENQCFVYHGPDTTYAGHEICLAARGTAESIDILDVTNHAAPVRIDSLPYPSGGYTHQAWFSEDHRYILLNDELDEQNVGNLTRTWIFDALDLDNIALSGGNGYFDHDTPAIDHNLYIRGDFVFQSNYRAGLRILRLTDLASSVLTEIGYFDVYPANDNPSFSGTWNHYPFFASGVIPVTDIGQGLFLLRPTNLCVAPASPTGLGAAGNGEHQIDLAWTGSGTPGNTFAVDRALGGCGGEFVEIASDLVLPAYEDLSASGVVTYGYRVRESDPSGFCTSAASSCVEASTTGSCTAAPVFAGLSNATNGAATSCQVALDWGPATAFCGGPAAYSVYRGTTDSFLPDAGNRIAQGLSGLATVDLAALPGTPAYYIVRATDTATGAEDGNLTRRSATATGPLADGTFVTGGEIGDPPLDTLGGTGGEVERPSAPEHAGWHVSTDRFHSGARSFFSTSSSSLCVSLEAGPMTLTSAQSSQLTFWTGWDIEPTYDGGIVQISTDGGTTWTQLTPAGGYPNTITESGNVCPAMPPGTPAFSSANQLTWQQKSISLVAYAGQSVKLAWRYGSDSAVDEEGWYVDDIALTHAQIPGICTSGLIFADGFATGTTGAWSNAIP
jgi:choice-of-anchor B domain-containing protein